MSGESMFSIEVSIFSKDGRMIDQWQCDNDDLDVFKLTYERRHKTLFATYGPLTYVKQDLAA